MIRRRKRHAQRLGTVVEALPFETQRAMLEGLRRYDRIIAGAYSDRQGGVCSMLAAHRCGGRTDYRSFARSGPIELRGDEGRARSRERDLERV